MKTLVCSALIIVMAQPLIGLPSFAAKVSERTAETGLDNAAKCRKLTGSWRQAGETSHMRAVLNKRSKVEKKMKKLGCPIPTASMSLPRRMPYQFRSNGSP
jgi:hypothetical protein